ncbi:hypothetical protein OO012_20040, partial [Rhodobacteraceae bacterium KMM 6894]|nr:hypothetical protein [Rhodobacteraceae bacterium KMM 6894]
IGEINGFDGFMALTFNPIPNPFCQVNFGIYRFYVRKKFLLFAIVFLDVHNIPLFIKGFKNGCEKTIETPVVD